jgi:hypothetical protein
MQIIKNGRTILSVADWFAAAPPKRAERHWVEGRSAMELAKAWFPVPGKPSVPEEFLALLHTALDRLTFSEGEPEAIVRFDTFRGEPRNCDLLVQGSCDLGKITISIEAKADEKFGETTVGQRFEAGLRIERSNLPQRIRLLTAAVLGREVDLASRPLRYQLLHSTAAALSAAQQQGATAAIFVVHEFITNSTRDFKHKENADDLDRFVSVLSNGRISHVENGQLFGPLRVPGNVSIPSNIDFFAGKAIRNVRA